MNTEKEEITKTNAIFGAAVSSINQEIDKSSTQLTNAQGELKKMESRLRSANEEERSAIQRQIDTKKTEIQKLNTQIQQQTSSRDAYNEQMTKNAKTLAQKEQEIEASTESLADLLEKKRTLESVI